MDTILQNHLSLKNGIFSFVFLLLSCGGGESTTSLVEGFRDNEIEKNGENLKKQRERDLVKQKEIDLTRDLAKISSIFPRKRHILELSLVDISNPKKHV